MWTWTWTWTFGLVGRGGISALPPRDLMATESFRISTAIAATPAQIYEAWLDSEQHAAMTGGEATVDGSVGGTFHAWGPYISGTTVELETDRRIVQSWRTNEFPADAPDSRLEIESEPGSGTRIIAMAPLPAEVKPA